MMVFYLDPHLKIGPEATLSYSKVCIIHSFIKHKRILSIRGKSISQMQELTSASSFLMGLSMFQYIQESKNLLVCLLLPHSVLQLELGLLLLLLTVNDSFQPQTSRLPPTWEHTSCHAECCPLGWFYLRVCIMSQMHQSQLTEDEKSCANIAATAELLQHENMQPLQDLFVGSQYTLLNQTLLPFSLQFLLPSCLGRYLPQPQVLLCLDLVVNFPAVLIAAALLEQWPSKPAAASPTRAFGETMIFMVCYLPTSFRI